MYGTFLFVRLLIHLIWHYTFSLFTKIFSFIKRGISFHIIGCIFVTLYRTVKVFCIVLCSWHTVTFVDTCSQILQEMWAQNSVTAQTIMRLRCMQYTNGSTSSMGKWNQTVNELLFLSFMAKLPYTQLAMWQKCLQQKCLQQRSAPKVLMVKIPDMRITMWSKNFISELKAEMWIDICTPIFIGVLFTIAKRWKQPKCPSTDDWINQVWSTHTIEYYSALKKKEILTHSTTRVNLEDITLSEMSQSQKTECSVIPLPWAA